ncbi:MAG: pyruvate carboxylase [Myxococcales bacterium]|nr:pyruvate carboxylase [Myxococcales bacterium]
MSTLPSSPAPVRATKKFQRILVANRSEIAIRVFRACSELGIRTLGIVSKEDKAALHRYKADETYLLNEAGGPRAQVGAIAAYLDIENIVAIARRHGADAVHPGYGFLSENADFARACAQAGIVFIGPSPQVLDLMGDKTAARSQALAVGLPVVPGSDGALASLDAACACAARIGYPVIVKAAFGGGGRGMRVCHHESELIASLSQAEREAKSAFGRGDVFIEKYIDRPKHIEVQVLADAYGHTVHLYERDCSVQRRHQKVVEVAPAPRLSPKLRERLCYEAVRLAKSVGYQNAGTVEFLVDREGAHYFIEMNPRIQVEHTVTELVTGIDIVKSQIHVAEGYPLASPEIGISAQDAISLRGFAVQARITTEDPTNHFIPDYGRITHYRSAAGFGIRLDAGTAFSGAIITPHYDSLLVKVCAHALTWEDACRKLDRALAEWRVRGVRTNIKFLRNVVRHPRFVAGEATTGFIADSPELLSFAESHDRATRILQYIGDLSINGNPTVKGERPSGLRKPVVPAHDPDGAIPPGLRDRWKQLGNDAFCAWLRDHKPLLLTDTTLRDAHQSLLATRLRTFDMLKVAPAIAQHVSGLFSLELWGGATFDVAMRFLHEDPWQRLAILRKQIPNILFQMLLRGANAVGYSNYPDNVVRKFVHEAARVGIDVFRVFDSLNWLPGLLPALGMVRESGALAEAAICYTGNIDDPKRDRYPLHYYVSLAKELERAGAHILAIKDMAGLLRPFAARRLVTALRQEVGLPIHLHTHDTAGMQGATLLLAAEAGVDIVDVALGAMSGLTSQPSCETLVAAFEHHERATGLDFNRLLEFSDYWEAVRAIYQPFESGMKASAADVYIHEIPGGQYSNLRPQAESVGVGDRLPELKRMYQTVNQLLGDIVKVTPSSKMVGDLALFMLTNGLSPQDLIDRGRDLAFPESVVGYFAGEIGQPSGGFPQALRDVVLKGKRTFVGRPGETLSPVDFNTVKAELEAKIRRQATELEVISYLMYPKVFVEFAAFERKYTDVSMIPSDVLFYGLRVGEETEVEIERGKTLFIKLVAVSEPNEEGSRTLFFELNGHPREVLVHDARSGREAKTRLKADRDNLHHLASPMPGTVIDIKVKPGQEVREQERLLTIEAMKMEMAVPSPLTGVVKEIFVKPGERVDTGDLLLVFQ